MYMKTSPKRRLKGFSLIEVLVAVFVLSVGMLGAARIDILSLRSNASSAQRSQAVNLAYDMADRMRANHRAQIAVNGSAVGFSNAADATNAVAANNNKCSKTSTYAADNCTVAQMAAHDLQEWNDALALLLPNGAGVTCIDSTPNDGSAGAPACDNIGSTYAVKVWWSDMEQGGAATKLTVLTMRP